MGTIARAVTALESIAASLAALAATAREMREEQAAHMARARTDAEQAPARVVELVERIRAAAGGMIHGN